MGIFGTPLCSVGGSIGNFTSVHTVNMEYRVCDIMHPTWSVSRLWIQVTVFWILITP